jgi:hypothetical protein
MWFILLFALCGLAIPIAIEIHARGRDNILARSSRDLIRSRAGKALGELLGQTYGWLHSLVALTLLFLFAWGVLRLASWLLGLIF